MLVAAVTLGMGAMTSCSDDDDSTMSRLFRPVVSEDDIIAGLDADNVPYIEMKWSNYASANQYVVTIETEDKSFTDTKVVEDTTFVRFSGLDYDITYNFSIHAANSITGLESKDYVFSAKTADYPTDLKGLQSTDIIDTQARVSWNVVEGAPYDKLVVMNGDDEVVSEIELTPEEYAAGSTILRGLEANTGYRVMAYSNGKYMGKKTFKTLGAEAYEGTVVDLRGISPEDSYKWFSMSSDSQYANAIDSLVALYPDQDLTIILQGGVEYRMPTLNLPSTTGTITMVTGQSLSGNAIFRVSGNFNAPADVSVGGIVLDKLTFSDEESKPKTDSNYGGTYLFNLNGKNSKIGTIKITNSEVKYKRGVCRLQGGPTIDNYIIDNCVMDSIGGYAIANGDNASSQFNHIKVTNSTFANCDKLFVGTKGPTPESLIVENCTFVYCNKKNNIFDYKPEFDGIKVTNCVFGKGLAEENNGYNAAVPTCSDVYFTSDYSWALDAETGMPKKAIGESIKETTDELFRNPAISDFTIMVKDFNYGDPRWIIKND